MALAFSGVTLRSFTDLRNLASAARSAAVGFGGVEPPERYFIVVSFLTLPPLAIRSYAGMPIRFLRSAASFFSRAVLAANNKAVGSAVVEVGAAEAVPEVPLRLACIAFKSA